MSFECKVVVLFCKVLNVRQKRKYVFIEKQTSKKKRTKTNKKWMLCKLDIEVKKSGR